MTLARDILKNGITGKVIALTEKRKRVEHLKILRTVCPLREKERQELEKLRIDIPVLEAAIKKQSATLSATAQLVGE